MKFQKYMTVKGGMICGCLIGLLIVLFNCSPLSAQVVYGSLYGTALDSSGAAVANAIITVISEQKGISFTGKTDAAGEYRIDHLVPDTYDVTVSATGFKQFNLKGVHVNAGDSPRVDATMQIGSATESVIVEANAEALLKTETQDVSLSINQDTISNIPLQSRAANNLILLNPGASTYFGQWGIIPEVAVGGAWYNVNGQPQGSEDFLLDGTDNEDLMLGTIVINAAPDSLQAVKVITSNYSADVGKTNSAVLPMETKSGSNTFHGEISDFRTSSANLARNPFNASQSAPNKLAPALNNQPEVNFGGPVVKNRAFFFFDYYANRGRLGGSTLTTVPTAHLHNTCLGLESTSTGQPGCDFGEYSAGLGSAGVIYQSDGSPYPNNVIPAAQLSQPALNLLKLVPLPKGSSSLLTNNYGASGTGIANTGQYTARVDGQVSATAHVFGRYTYFHDQVQGASAFGNHGAGGPNIVGVGGISQGHNQSWALGLDDAIKPNLLTDLRLGYYRYRVQSVKFDQGQDTATQLGMPNLNNPNYALTGGSPAFLVSGTGSGVGAMSFGTGLAVNTCNCPLQQLEDQYQIVNNWTKIMGTHAFRFGADLRYGRQFRADSGVNRTGNISFGAGPTSLNGSGGFGFATFMLGEVTAFARDVSVAGNNAKEFQRRTFYYAQDTWRATHKLTVNYGLRWEIVFPERVNAAGKGSHLDLGTGNLVVAGIGGNSLDMNYKTTWGNLAPRLGFSYQIDKLTVIRAGYGRSFAMGTFGTVFAVDQTESLPVFATQAVTAPSVTASVFNLSAGPPSYIFPAVPSNGMLPLPNGVTPTTRPDPLRLSTVDSWNVSFERALTSTMTATVAYVGNKGTHVWSGIFSTVNANPIFTVLPASNSVVGRTLYYDPTVPPTTSDPFNAAYPGIDANGHTSVTKYLLPYYSKYGWTQGINYNCNCSDNHFNALQVSVSKQFSKGLSFTSNYAWQMTRDYDSAYFVVDRKAVYGPESFSKKHVFNLYGFYQLPFGKKGQFLRDVPRAVDYIVGGYQISPVITIQSGLPFSPIYTNCAKNVPSGSAPCFPNRNGSFHVHLGGYIPGSHSRSYFTPDANLLSASNPTYGPFSYPLLDQVGNAHRNSLWGPGMWNADISLSKTVPIAERLQAEFRVDAFNGLNHINPGNPLTGIDSPVGGRIFSMATNTSPRQLEFAGKITF